MLVCKEVEAACAPSCMRKILIGQEMETDSTEVETDSTEMETDSTEVETDSTEIETDSTEIETDSTEMETDSTEVETDSTVSLCMCDTPLKRVWDTRPMLEGGSFICACKLVHFRWQLIPTAVKCAPF